MVESLHVMKKGEHIRGRGDSKNDRIVSSDLSIVVLSAQIDFFPES